MTVNLNRINGKREANDYNTGIALTLVMRKKGKMETLDNCLVGSLRNQQHYL